MLIIRTVAVVISAGLLAGCARDFRNDKELIASAESVFADKSSRACKAETRAVLAGGDLPMRPHALARENPEDPAEGEVEELCQGIKARDLAVSERCLFVCFNRWRMARDAAGYVLAAANGREKNSMRQQAILFAANKVSADTLWFGTAKSVEASALLSAFAWKAISDSSPRSDSLENSERHSRMSGMNKIMSAMQWYQASKLRVKHLQEVVRLGQRPELWEFVSQRPDQGNDLPGDAEYFRNVAEDTIIDLINLQYELAGSTKFSAISFVRRAGSGWGPEPRSKWVCDLTLFGRLPTLAGLDHKNLCHLAEQDWQSQHPPAKE